MRNALTAVRKYFWWYVFAGAVVLEKKEAARKAIKRLNEIVDLDDFRSYKGKPHWLRTAYQPEIHFLAVRVNGRFPMGFDL